MKRHLVALLAALTGLAFAQDRIGDWTITTETDIFTDETKSYAALLPLEYPPGGSTDVLVVSCYESDIAPLGVLIVAGTSAPIFEDDVEILYRVDAREPVTRSWRASGEAIGPLAASAQRELITDLLDGERFALRYSALGSSRTYVYVVSGFREVLETLGCYGGEL